MDIELFRDICISLPHCTEEFPFDDVTLCFKVSGKLFSILPLNDGDRANLKCDPHRALELRATFSGIVPGYHMNKVHWNTVCFNADVSDEIIRELIHHSYDLVVSNLPKKTRIQLGL